MEYSFSKNEKFNSLEITFNGKPSEDVRNALKALKFRWHGVKKLWYGFADVETVKAAIDGAGTGEEITNPAVIASPVTKPAVNSFGVKVGDLFYMSWGYEQTNVDFFQVVSLVGDSSVRVRNVNPPIIAETDSTGMSCYRTYKLVSDPLPAASSVFIDDDEKGDLKRLKKVGNQVSIKIGNHLADKCEGETKRAYVSWYY